MSKTIKILKYFLIFSIIALVTVCAPARKNPYLEKRKQASRVNTSQLGRNKYYFTPSYQKKLKKTFRTKKQQ